MISYKYQHRKVLGAAVNLFAGSHRSTENTIVKHTPQYSTQRARKVPCGNTTVHRMEVKIMKEKVLNGNRNGMQMLLLFGLLYIAAVVTIVIGGLQLDHGSKTLGAVLLSVGIFWAAVGWIPFCGLTVIKPQEAVVLTLFGNYVGTLKEPGFYFVNPFCSAVNPAAKTRLRQSGDVDGDGGKSMPVIVAGSSSGAGSSETPSKKISLKIMTLNNNRQKINDCLGNPIEIGIAVM